MHIPPTFTSIVLGKSLECMTWLTITSDSRTRAIVSVIKLLIIDTFLPKLLQFLIVQYNSWSLSKYFPSSLFQQNYKIIVLLCSFVCDVYSLFCAVLTLFCFRSGNYFPPSRRQVILYINSVSKKLRTFILPSVLYIFVHSIRGFRCLTVTFVEATLTQCLYCLSREAKCGTN